MEYVNKGNRGPRPPVYGLTKVEPDKMADVNALSLPAGSDGTLRPWDKQAGEDIDWYEKFLYYLRLGPERSMQKALRFYLTERQKLLPGEPIPTHLVYSWYKESLKWQWLLRARHWDRENLQDLQVAIENERQKRIEAMAEEHIAGWELFQRVAVRSLFQRDEAGNILSDEDGQPRLKEIEDVGTAARVFKQAQVGKRTEMGLPTELIAMKGVDLIKRWLELNNNLQEADDEPIDGEVTDVTEEESA